ncbi:hypothetical protein EV363DRAFT_1166205 [Boletus edulis]|nr:hypothetical protein EV363DRAFT_1166205 [Boletus edulis]
MEHSIQFKYVLHVDDESLTKGSDDREHMAIPLMTPRTSRSRRVIKLGKDVDEYRVT